MDCQVFSEELNTLIDQRVDPRESGRLQGHAEVCPSCCEDLYFYSACFGEFESAPTVVSNDSKTAASFSFVALGLSVAAAVLLISLTPVGEIFFSVDENKNLVRMDAALAVSPRQVNEPVMKLPAEQVKKVRRLEFWQDTGLKPVINLDHLQKVIDDSSRTNLDEMTRVGRSLSSVWERIQDDDYWVPILKQSALLLVRAT